MRIFVSTLRKLAKRPATLVTFGVLSGLLVFIMLGVATAGENGGNGMGNGPGFEPRALLTFPGAYEHILAFMLGLGGLFAVTYGAAIAGSEWSWGTLKVAVARGEARARYVIATFAGIAVVVAVGMLVTFAVGVLGAALAAAIAGVPLDGIGDAETLGRLPEQLARGAVAIVAQGAVGFAVATLARSQLAGIGAGIALYFVGTFASVFLPDIVQYLPFQLAGVATGGGGFGPADEASALSADTALVLLVAWPAGALVLASWWTQRAEITD
jgi:ABC-type transport system involved in multi-copper enzyme maturation permease subunit